MKQSEEKTNYGTLMDRSLLYEQAMGYLDDETTDEEFDLILEIEKNLNEKISAYGFVIKRLNQAAGLIDSEIKFLQDEISAAKVRKSHFENKANRLKNTLLEVMKKHDIDKVDNGTVMVSARKNPPKVIVDPNLDLKTIPRRFLRVKEELVKKVVKEELESGIDLEWASLIQDKRLDVK